MWGETLWRRAAPVGGGALETGERAVGAGPDGRMLPSSPKDPSPLCWAVRGDAGGRGRGPGLRGEMRSPLPLDELTLKLHLSLKQEQEKDERPKDTVGGEGDQQKLTGR